MSLQDVPQLTFDFLPALPIVVQPSAGQITSDAGLLPLAQADARLRYTQRLAVRCRSPFSVFTYAASAVLGNRAV